MNRRRPKIREGEPAIHTNAWVLKLERATGETGYYCHTGPDGIIFKPERGGLVYRFPSRKKAEEHVKWLHDEYGLDVEEATPEEVVHESTYSLWLGGGEWPDGISVERDERTGERLLLVRDDGEETSCGIPNEVADMLVRLFDKLRQQLRRANTK